VHDPTCLVRVGAGTLVAGVVEAYLLVIGGDSDNARRRATLGVGFPLTDGSRVGLGNGESAHANARARGPGNSGGTAQVNACWSGRSARRIAAGIMAATRISADESE